MSSTSKQLDAPNELERLIAEQQRDDTPVQRPERHPAFRGGPAENFLSWDAMNEHAESLLSELLGTADITGKRCHAKSAPEQNAIQIDKSLMETDQELWDRIQAEAFLDLEDILTPQGVPTGTYVETRRPVHPVRRTEGDTSLRLARWATKYLKHPELTEAGGIEAVTRALEFWRKAQRSRTKFWALECRRLGATQTELAAKLGISQQALSKWQRAADEDVPNDLQEQLSALLPAIEDYLQGDLSALEAIAKLAG